MQLGRLPWRDPNGAEQQLNVIKRCSIHYEKLGMHLLNDENLEAVRGIGLQYSDPEKITTEIFRQWIQGGSTVSWQHLRTVLQDIDLKSLAEELKDALSANKF